MRIIKVKSKQEGYLLPDSWLSLGWMRGYKTGADKIRGVYFSVILPFKWFSRWEDFDTGSTVEGYRMLRLVFYTRKNTKWYTHSSCYPYELEKKVLQTREQKDDEQYRATTR